MAESFFTELKRRNVFKVGAAYLVLAWVVVQIASEAVPALHLPEWIITAVFFFGIMGFPFALFFAWAFELTPDGMKKADEVDKSESISHQTGQKINYILVGLMAVALSYFIWESRFSNQVNESLTNNSPASEATSENNPVQGIESASDSSDKVQASIAVLPFVNMSSEKEQEYFSDGLSEELLNVLAHVSQLKVAARTSSFYFKGKNLPIVEIAKQLNVAHVLEGSVRKAGDTIRITAQLIRAADGFHLWSKTYDRKLDDVFVIQDEISHAIVDALKIKMGLTEDLNKTITTAIQSTSSEAHAAYLLGKELLRKRTNQSIQDAISQFQRSLEIDPDYAPALARQAEGWLLLRASRSTYGDLSQKESASKARPLLEKALALKPELAEAHAVMGLLYRDENKLKLSLKSLDKALSINPNLTSARVWRATLYQDMGLYQDQFQALWENYQHDPLSVLTTSNLLAAMIFQNQMEGFDAILQSLYTFAPRRALDIEGTKLANNGEYGKAAMMELWEFDEDGRRNVIPLMFDLHVIGLGQTVKPLVDKSSRWHDKVFWYLVQGEWSKARELVQQRSLEKGEDYRGWLANLYSQERNWAKTNELYASLWDEAADSILDNRNFGQEPLLYLAMSYLHTGKTHKVQPLLKLVEDETDKRKSQGVIANLYSDEQMAVYLIQGEIELALDIVEQAVNDGWIDFSEIEEPWFDSVMDHPRYQAAKAIMLENQQKQRQIFLKEVCTENPFAEFWQPGEENCKELFLEVRGSDS